MSQSRERKRKFDIPIWCKANLSIEEAAAYSGIGMAKLYDRKRGLPVCLMDRQPEND